ncbi:MAG: hypothetical protein AVDCRST_MAG86-2367, partial [uncultured Truepera sp.]
SASSSAGARRACGPGTGSGWRWRAPSWCGGYGRSQACWKRLSLSFRMKCLSWRLEPR